MLFREWLLQEMERVGLSNSELARASGVSHARVSQILGGEQPGNRFLKKITSVLGKSEIEVFRAAGVIKSGRDLDSPSIIELLADFNSLTDEDQISVLEHVKALRALRGQQARRKKAT